ERQQAETARRVADQRKDEFLATLAHELRNPLAPICTGLDTLKRGRDDTASREKIYGMLDRQAQRLTRLVDDLLDVSRITRGTFELHKEHVDLANVVRSAVEASQPFIDSAQHQLSVNLQHRSLILNLDSARITQVISNLLVNAAKYTEPGGQIWITTRLEGLDAVVSVEDNGRGISPDMLSKVCDMFIQANSGVNRGQEGLGVGLALAQTIITQHEGRLEVKSDGLGQGSTFT